MSAKRALVVDDSRSARAFLARILERHEIAVDAAESAEAAIEYLARNKPDVIFMDHMMPGMDGFQAVQSIKNNPRTAAIPILMYTSQEGDLYAGQARALGADGVLPKQIKQSDAAAQYLNATASNVAKSTGQMSLAELLDFEAGRRWRNPYWVIEQSAVSDPTKLQREQLMTTAFMAELAYENLQTNKFNSVVLGQILASLTRSNDRAAIESQLQRVRATNAR